MNRYDAEDVPRRIKAIGANFDKLLEYRLSLMPHGKPLIPDLAYLFYDFAMENGFSPIEAQVISGWRASISRPSHTDPEILSFDKLVATSRLPPMRPLVAGLFDDPAPYIRKITHHLSQGIPYSKDDAGEMSALTVAISGGGEPPIIWHGIDLSGIPERYRLRCIVLLYAPGAPLTQEVVNFLVGGGRPMANLLDYKVATMAVPDIADFGTDDFNRMNLSIGADLRTLADGFVRQLLDEAAPHRQNVPVGVYHMSPPEFPTLDNNLTVPYTGVRFFMQPGGIRGTLDMLDRTIAPFFWSPEYTTVYEYGDTIGWLLNVLFAGVWRDASVVRHKWRHVTKKTSNSNKRNKKKIRRKHRLAVMPRTVYHVDWADDTDRRTIRTRHAVRGFYRRLPAGHHTGSTAIKNARSEGHPPPPGGWTYVRAHQRGRGEMADNANSDLPEIVCRGLQTVTLLMELGQDE